MIRAIAILEAPIPKTEVMAVAGNLIEYVLGNCATRRV